MSIWNVVPALLDEDAMTAATDEQLSLTISLLLEEQTRRARAAHDPEALAEEAFETAFDHAGRPRLPYLVGNVVVCPGGKMEKSASSHDCVFVAVGEEWVWQHPDVLFDDLRQVPGSRWKRSVTVLPAVEGLEFDVVTSQARSGGSCRMKQARSYAIQRGDLVEVPTKARTAAGHR